MAKKLSVSVPDDLWEHAQTQRPDLNPSHLVQAALEAWIRPADAAGFSLARPQDAEAGFEAARRKLAERARSEFEDGYRAAVELAGALDWWYVQRLAKSNFAVLGWSSSLAESRVAEDIGNVPKGWGTETEVIGGLLKALGGHISPWGDDMPMRTIPFLRGFAQAFRDLWTQVNDGEPATVSEGGVALGS